MEEYEEYEDYYDEEEELTLGSALSTQFGKSPWYVSSVGIHCVIFLILLLVTGDMVQKETRIVTIEIDIIHEDPMPEETPPEPEDPIKTKVKVDHEIKIDTPVIVNTKDVQISDHFETEDDNEAETALGDPDNICNIDAAFTGSPAILGVGATGGKGGGGKFGRGDGGGRRNKIKIGGGDPTTEKSVRWALKWLAAHQEYEGNWSCKKYGGGGHGGDDVAVTSLALLAFLGNGNSNKWGRYRRNVAKATEWLLTQQNAEGLIGIHRYTGGISTMAIVEAYGMGNEDIREQAQMAVDWAVKSQNTTGAWDYSPNSGRHDTSVTGWWIMGLKSAKVSGLNVPYDTMNLALDYIKKCTTTNGRVSYSSKGDAIKRGGGSARMTAVALTCLQFLGESRKDKLVVATEKETMKSLPKASRPDFYLTYYQALGLFQTGIEEPSWIRFNEPMKTSLTTTQVMVGTVEDKKGSWEFENDKYGPSWGRVGQTALGALMLEVYYRYEEVAKH